MLSRLFGVAPPPGTEDQSDAELLTVPKSPRPVRNAPDVTTPTQSQSDDVTLTSQTPVVHSTPKGAADDTVGYTPPTDPRFTPIDERDESLTRSDTPRGVTSTRQYNVMPSEQWWDEPQAERQRRVRFDSRCEPERQRRPPFDCDFARREYEEDECRKTMGQYRQATPMPKRYRGSTGSSDDSAYRSFLEDFSLMSGTDTEDSPVSKCHVKPTKFTGTNWPGYRLHFLSVVQANCWNTAEAARVLKACLNEDAALVLKRSLRHKDATLEQIFRCLDERYLVSGPDYVLRGKIRRTVQKHDQTLDAYQVELMALLANRADAEDCPMVLEQFIYGLHDARMQKYVAKRSPRDLHDALILAKEFQETSQWMDSANKRSHKRVGAITAAAPQQSRPQQSSEAAAAPPAEDPR